MLCLQLCNRGEFYLPEERKHVRQKVHKGRTKVSVRTRRSVRQRCKERRRRRDRGGAARTRRRWRKTEG